VARLLGPASQSPRDVLFLIYRGPEAREGPTAITSIQNNSGPPKDLRAALRQAERTIGSVGCGGHPSAGGRPVSDMTRREFIALIGGAGLLLTAKVRRARAQQGGKTARVGYIRAGTPNNDPFREAFVRGMRDLGYVEGRNIAFEFRNYGDDVDSIASHISDLLQAKVDIIVAGGTAAVQAAQAATQSIPIVMGAVADPMGSGLIASLARPGGNTTGLTLQSAELTTKRLELLKEVMPQAVRIAILQQPGNPAHPMFIKEIEPSAESLALTYRIFEARGSEDFARSFALMREWPADVVSVLDDATFISYRTVMAEAAARQRLPLICGFREMTEAGCLFSYSASLRDMWYRSATFVDKILKGAKPSDLPVQHGTQFELVVNLRTAKALGFQIPDQLLARADGVIE
jgi:putative tryptophan/tyrosine transport system substrate-binding protein